MKRFGEKLRALREERSLSLRELAAILGYKTHSYINEVELGRKVPTVDLVLKTARFFHVTADALLKDEIEMSFRGVRRKTRR